MYQVWPNKDTVEKFPRCELAALRDCGYQWTDPFEVVEIFENKIATFAGAKYAVAVDCCSHGLFLCLKYLKASGAISIPKHTYISVPMQILHAGCTVEFNETQWQKRYELHPYSIWDAAALWEPKMFVDDFFVISFQIKKPLPIGKGGMILTNNKEAFEWLKKSRYDGRNIKSTQPMDNVDSLGWHYYMIPEDAARGILLFDNLGSTTNCPSWENYVDVSSNDVFKK
jgi:dTDP-4-amino-4,6-dideoxygalactose transaminase